jgi:hypothetical protein
MTTVNAIIEKTTPNPKKWQSLTGERVINQISFLPATEIILKRHRTMSFLGETQASHLSEMKLFHSRTIRAWTLGIIDHQLFLKTSCVDSMLNAISMNKA